jgi:cellulose biosynthesis protein BcsQ
VTRTLAKTTIVIVVGTLKGGVGKTRLAMLMALFLGINRGLTVHVIDGDTVSQTAHDWQQDTMRRDAQRLQEDPAAVATWPATVTVTRHPFDDIDDYIDGLLGTVDVVIADIGGGNRAVLEAALTRAKLFLAPVGADPSETRKLPATWKCARTAAADSTVGGFKGYVVLSRTDHRTRLPADARAQLTSGPNPYPVADTEMRFGVAYQRAYATVPRDFLDVPALLDEVGLSELLVTA